MVPRGPEYTHCSHSVYLKIEQRNVSCLVMRRLRRAMHDQLETLRSKQFFDQGTVANIHRGVREALCRALKPLQVPQRVSCGPEEYAAHVVIHAGDLVTLPLKMFHGSRP